MKQFVEVLDRSGDRFGCICSTFSGFIYEKKKAGIFDGPQIKKLLRNHHVVNTVTVVEARAWNAFSNVVITFLATKKLTIIERGRKSFPSACKN